ncbi:predicted protein [Plenodomus lingam JN3]|uniref:Predicted protein n=1 Tax=Leptosphaeria maculans (strain JN3 / isolate v23.1.3 / race Av1-4-5-6-7-8) TaxID=985895 RepID=E5A0A9_LEPMJ|nr:predicted protein [Plenodomus lingam JN3]CBX96969.1 predicted protein [Plenodomus lingam JN3]
MQPANLHAHRPQSLFANHPLSTQGYERARCGKVVRDLDAKRFDEQHCAPNRKKRRRARDCIARHEKKANHLSSCPALALALATYLSHPLPQRPFARRTRWVCITTFSHFFKRRLAKER